MEAFYQLKDYLITTMKTLHRGKKKLDEFSKEKTQTYLLGQFITHYRLMNPIDRARAYQEMLDLKRDPNHSVPGSIKPIVWKGVEELSKEIGVCRRVWRITQ